MIMKRPYIKICGVTSPDEARAAVLAGADLLGLNFHPESVRAVGFHTAKIIKEAALRTFNPKRRGFKPAIVAVFVNPPSELVEGVIQELKPDLLQFHGDETPEQCLRYNHPFLKGVRVASHDDITTIPSFITPKSKTFLIDAFNPLSFGGTGTIVPMELARRALEMGRGFLAGGLTPANVGQMVETLHPYGVDVASGVEDRPGNKSDLLMHAFVRAVEEAAERINAG